MRFHIEILKKGGRVDWTMRVNVAPPHLSRSDFKDYAAGTADTFGEAVTQIADADAALRKVLD